MTDFLVAECAIRQLYARYCDAAWRKDTESFVDCFTEGATWKIAGKTIVGRAEIGSCLEAFMAQAEKVMMFLGMPVLEVDNGTATSRVQVTELLKLKDGSAIRTLGIYYDRFAREGDQWRIQWHHFNLYYYGPPDLSEPYYECLEFGPPPGMPGPDDPTTIRNR